MTDSKIIHITYLRQMKKIFSAFCRRKLNSLKARKKLVATEPRREGVYNWAGKPRVIFAKRRSGGAGGWAYFMSQTKNKSEQSKLCSDVEGMDTLDATRNQQKIRLKSVP